MRNRIVPAILGIAFLLGVVCVLRPLFGCGGTPPQALFVRTARPDAPLEKFVRGDLGVLQGSYPKSYLYAAYRVLASIGFDPKEQQAVLSYWEDAQGHRMMAVEPDAAIAEWVQVRKNLPGAGRQAEIKAYRTVEKYYFSYLNCPDDAFRTAVRTLQQRMEKFGPNSRELEVWVEGQDAVFANCAGPQRIPAALTATDALLIRADRAYQIAAANFYSGNFDAAEQIFRAIAQDRSSPWRRIAPYLVARTLLRKATLGGPREEADKVALAQAETQLESILRNPAMSDTQEAARRLLGAVRFRLRPKERLHELAQAVLRKNSGDTLKQNLWDYRALLDRVPDAQNSDDLTAWIFTFADNSKASFDISLENWRRTSSLPWLVAALAKAHSDYSGVPSLLEAAVKIQPGSPAFLTATYHVLRLTIELGRTEDARRRLDDLIAGQGTGSARNLFLIQRTALATNFEEFLKFSLREPLGVCCDIDGHEIPLEQADSRRWLSQLKTAIQGPLLDTDSTRILNKRLPLSLLRQAASSSILPPRPQEQLALAAWVRAANLGNDPVATDLVNILAGYHPELEPYLKSYREARDARARRFASVFVILKSPGARPYVTYGVGRTTALPEMDELRENWWCRFDLGRRLEEPNSSGLWQKWNREKLGGKPDPDASLAFPEFLTEAQKAAARREWESISSIGAAPNYLTREVLEWAKTHPDDPRVPEALYEAVRSTHLGCTDPESSKWSKAAFQMLHKRYPASPWAEKTKYWY